MDTLVKGLLYIGTVVSVGAGLFGWFVAPQLSVGSVARRARLIMLAGAAVVVIASPLLVAISVVGLIGYFDLGLTGEFLLATRAGNATLARLALVAVVAASTLWPLPRPAGPLLFCTAAVGLLATFSWSSHAAAIGGTLPFLADLVHFGAGAVWAGVVLYTAWLPSWHPGAGAPAHELITALRRVSRLGLLSVLLLLVTGVYAALIHVRTPEILVTSQYGEALVLKNLLVIAIVVMAALNRWLFLPALVAGRPHGAFPRLFRLEAVLLLVVLAATGLLTTSVLPHEPGTPVDPLESLRNFLPF